MSELKVWAIEQRKVSDLIEHDRNPRKISEKKFAKLKERILSQGFRTPVCVDNDGVLLAGHQRFKALVDMGLGDMEIPVSVPPYKLTEKMKREILASDNLAFGEFDWDIMNDDYDLEELAEWGFDGVIDGKTSNESGGTGTPEQAAIDGDTECPACGELFMAKENKYKKDSE